MRGVSELDLDGKPFYDPAALPAFVTALKSKLRTDIPIIELDMDINDPLFAEAVVNTLLNMLKT